jgi:hypothetical protein
MLVNTLSNENLHSPAPLFASGAAKQSPNARATVMKIRRILFKQKLKEHGTTNLYLYAHFQRLSKNKHQKFTFLQVK